MKQDNTKVEIRYRIVKIQTTKFSIEDLAEDIIQDFFSREDSMELALNTSFNIDSKDSLITIDINTKLIDKARKNVLVEHTGRTAYQLQKIDKAYDKETKSYKLPDGLVVQLYSFAYTHARALLSTELSPTLYKDKYLLPVIDPRLFIKKQ